MDGKSDGILGACYILVTLIAAAVAHPQSPPGAAAGQPIRGDLTRTVTPDPLCVAVPAPREVGEGVVASDRGAQTACRVPQDQ